jgi:putative two-component system response regulator
MDITRLKSKKVADIMIVDDEPANLQVLSGILKEKGYKVRPASSGRQALQAAQIELPDLVLLDINMPEMNGYEICKRLKNDIKLWNIPVIFISALNETLDKIKAFSVGGVDYVTKPFNYEEVQSRVDTHLKLHFLQLDLESYNNRLEDLVMTQVKEISESQMATIFALAELAESRDDDTGKHLERVQIFCKLLCLELAEKPEYKNEINPYFIKELYHASPLHDIGKVAIPDNILLKQGKLTPEEFETMKKHTVFGSKTLQRVHMKYPNNSFINMGIDIAHYHHEKWDGSGYPERLKGTDIPLCARIMTVADVYDALRSRRCYKKAFSHEESYKIIIDGEGAQFDPEVIRSFQEVEKQFNEITENMNEKNGDH